MPDYQRRLKLLEIFAENKGKAYSEIAPKLGITRRHFGYELTQAAETALKHNPALIIGHQFPEDETILREAELLRDRNYIAFKVGRLIKSYRSYLAEHLLKERTEAAAVITREQREDILLGKYDDQIADYLTQFSMKKLFTHPSVAIALRNEFGFTHFKSFKEVE